MKKRLLNEDITRRFMKLANLQPLAENFIDETEGVEEVVNPDSMKRDDEEVNELHGAYQRDDEMPEDELPPEEEVPVDEPMPDEELPGEEGPLPGGEVDVMSLVDAIAGAIQQETGVEVAVEGGAEEGGEEELGEPGLEEPMPGEEEEAALPPGPEEDDIEEDLAAANIALEEDDDLVNEVARRVARRLLRASASNPRPRRRRS